MVARHVRVDSYVRAARQRRQLQLGQLDDDAVDRGQLGQPLDQRDADVAAKHGRRGTRGEDGGGQCRRGCLALRAGDANGRRWAQAQEEVDLAHDGHHACVLDLRQGAAQAWLGGRVVAADRGRGADHGLRGEGGSWVDLGSKHQSGVRALDLRQRAAKLIAAATVVNGDLRADTGQKAGKGDAAARQAEDGYGPAGERVERQLLEIDRCHCRARHAHVVVTSVEK